MAKRRVRLNDENDPLSSTDKVLARFEQVSKSTSQQDSNLTSQIADKSTSQEDKAQPLTPANSVTNNRTEKSTSQQDKKLTTQEADKSTIHEDEVSTSQQDKADSNNLKEKSTSQQADQIASPQYNNLGSQQANFSTSQQVQSEKAIWRKSTFQINSEVLHQLDKLHLTLQLELGKTNAPYKEVIVEEALVRLLEEVNSDRGALISALVERQKSRDKI